MQVRTENRLRGLRRGHRGSEAGQRPASQPPRSETIERSRHRAGPPAQDRATYNCSCGYVFDALVSTDVTCPHCGQGQAW